MTQDQTQFIQQLGSPDPHLRQQAVVALGKLRNAQAVGALMECLNDPKVEVQAAAAEALGQIGDDRAVKVLIESFLGKTYHRLDREGSPGKYFAIVASAAKALGQIGNAIAVEALFAEVNTYDRVNQERTAAAVFGLSFVRDERVLSVLLQALQSPSNFVRYHAALALGKAGKTQAVQPLIAALHDPFSTVQEAAVEALGNLRDPVAAEPLRRVFEDVEFFVPESAVDPYMLYDVRAHLRAAAARSLALLGGPELISLLEENLQSPQWVTQLAAAVGLARRRDSRVFDVLIKALSDKSTAIQIEAVKGLAYLNDSNAIPFLKEVTSKRDIPIRVIEAAKQAIEQIAEGAASA